MIKLAIKGGVPVMKRPLRKPYNISDDEIDAVVHLLKKGPLSDFIGEYGPYFLGGKKVQALENLFSNKFKVKHSVSFNSATTALQAAVAALGIGPGDEVIVSSFTMSASATCILFNGAVPRFADIDPQTFCISADSIRKQINAKTKAVIVVNLFGHPADLMNIAKLAKEYNLKVIEDNSQSPGATINGKYAGTIGDVGVFSFNVHKVIQSGEGGILVTNNTKYAQRAQLVRNHGEVVRSKMKNYNLGPIMGSNFRMTEITATIAYFQVKKLDFLNNERIKLAKYLSNNLKKIKGLHVLPEETSTKNVFYLFPIIINEEELGLTRNLFVDAMTAEGFPLSKGYVQPIYLLPLFKEKRVFNVTRFPFGSGIKYTKGLCPVAEEMHEKKLTLTDVCQFPNKKSDIKLFIKAIHKVISNRNELV